MKHLLQENPVLPVDMEVSLLDIGLMGYGKAHELQLEWVGKHCAGNADKEIVLITEHPPVYTLGRQGKTSSFLVSREEIAARGIEIIHTERGGDITYHGPGQLVVYPILNLRRRKLSVSEYISCLEEIMLQTAADIGVSANRDGRNRGVWVGDNKIGSVGIRIRHGICFHGLALNVNLSLLPFGLIEPCGLRGIGVTSLERELRKPVSMEMVKECMMKHIQAHLSG